jgi:hypothetical protein
MTNNGYEASIIKQFNKPGPKIHTNNNKDSWAKFTYFGKESGFITKLFRETQLRTAYKVNNTIEKRLTPKLCNSYPQQQFEKSGVYSLTCLDCQKKYVGQTARSFHTRYKEHSQEFKFNIRKSSFAAHVLDNNHSMGPIYEIMEVLYTTKIGRLMDTIERFHNYSVT